MVSKVQSEKLEQMAMESVERGTSLWQDAWHRLLKNKAAMIGLAILVFLVILALITPYIAPYSYEVQDLYLGEVPPNAQHWFGTDNLGRDLFTRVLYGGRISLLVGFLATGVSLIIGVSYGATAGFFGGRIDAAMMRFVDIMYSMPFIPFVIVLMVIFGRDFYLLFIALGMIQWLTMARIVRGQVLSLMKKEFIEAAVAMGVKKRAIIFRHLIPNVLGVVIVYSSLTVPSVMLEEAFLSFLGLGVQPPMSSWGILISEGVKYLEEAPWMIIFPGFALTITLFSLNFLGDGLRDALDPRSSKD